MPNRSLTLHRGNWSFLRHNAPRVIHSTTTTITAATAATAAVIAASAMPALALFLRRGLEIERARRTSGSGAASSPPASSSRLSPRARRTDRCRHRDLRNFIHGFRRRAAYRRLKNASQVLITPLSVVDEYYVRVGQVIGRYWRRRRRRRRHRHSPSCRESGYCRRWRRRCLRLHRWRLCYIPAGHHHGRSSSRGGSRRWYRRRRGLAGRDRNGGPIPAGLGGRGPGQADNGQRKRVRAGRFSNCWAVFLC